MVGAINYVKQYYSYIVITVIVISSSILVCAHAHAERVPENWEEDFMVIEFAKRHYFWEKRL